MRRKSRFRLFVLLVLCVVCAYLVLRPLLRSPSSPQQGPSHLPSQVTVRHVIDGDSFDTTERRQVRLLGIDTPEYGEPFARQARTNLEELILGKRVSLTYEADKRDRFGRLLCHVRIDDVWINRAQLREGLAMVYLMKPNTARRSELISAQNAARREKAGIWSVPPPPVTEDYYVRSVKRFHFHRPGCRSVRSMSARNKERLLSRDAALDMGLSPCRGCRP